MFPKGTKVLSVNVDSNTKIATVDFSRELVNNNTGGSLGEILMVYIVTNTLTGMDGVQSIRFSVEGNMWIH